MTWLKISEEVGSLKTNCALVSKRFQSGFSAFFHRFQSGGALGAKWARDNHCGMYGKMPRPVSHVKNSSTRQLH